MAIPALFFLICAFFYFVSVFPKYEAHNGGITPGIVIQSIHWDIFIYGPEY